MGQELNQLNLTVVALVALVAIVGLVALVMNAATVKIPGIATGSQLATAESDQNTAGNAFCRTACINITSGALCSNPAACRNGWYGCANQTICSGGTPSKIYR